MSITIITTCTVLFLSTLSLRRATQTKQTYRAKISISIHALLAESDPRARRASRQQPISIHALLAESDRREASEPIGTLHFYPRSPCGERQALCLPGWLRVLISIHALLAESDRALRQLQPALRHFYPRSPCGERQTSSR